MYSNYVDEHINNVDEIQTTLTEDRLVLKMKKCILFCENVEYLGHFIPSCKLEVGNPNTTYLRQTNPPSLNMNTVTFSVCITSIEDSSWTLKALVIRSINYYEKELRISLNSTTAN